MNFGSEFEAYSDNAPNDAFIEWMHHRGWIENTNIFKYLDYMHRMDQLFTRVYAGYTAANNVNPHSKNWHDKASRCHMQR